MKSFAFTIKVWPVVALVTIGLCYLTQVVAGWFGIALPDQQNVEIVNRCLENAFSSGRGFLIAAFLVAQVVVLMPVVEELLFRGLLFKVVCKAGHSLCHSIVRAFDYSIVVFSSALFSAAHYCQQPWPDSAFLALFFFGVAQCWIYRRTERIWCAMLNHALFNLTNLVLLFVV
jgi:membrane protease YdiL (CAAX protease family)